MTKNNLLDLLQLLSALESWSFANNQRLPDYLLEHLQNSVDVLREEVMAPSLADLKAAGWSHDPSQDFKLGPTPVVTLGNEIALEQLTSVMRRVSRLEARYDELHNAARACLRYNGVDTVRFNAAMRHMDALIQRHITEINEE